MFTRRVSDAWHQTRRVFGQAYHGAVQAAHQIHGAVDLGKRVFGALHPLVSQLGGHQVNKAILQGFSAYDRAAGDGLDLHNNVRHQVSRLRKAAPELDL